MTLALESHPSSVTFDTIASSLSDPSSRDAAIKKANSTFVFTLKNTAGADASWWIDLKKTGTLGRGTNVNNTEGQTANVTLSLSDADFADLVSGKKQAQKLFMGGGLKIKGDIMKATKVEGVLRPAKNAGASKL